MTTGIAPVANRLAPPRRSGDPAPQRRLGSVRRTASIDVNWRGGFAGEKLLHGRARDLATDASGATRVLSQASMTATLAFDKTITGLTANPAPARLGELIGQRGGGHLRVVMADIMPDLIASGNPLYLLLDDISGTSLISVWAWCLWNPDWLRDIESLMPKEQLDKLTRAPDGVCWGLRPGNNHFSPDSGHLAEEPADAGPVVNPEDPAGWHDFPELSGVSLRRARRIDVWRDAASGLIHIDSGFQDSAPRPANPDGSSAPRAAVHEYRLTATLDPDRLALKSLAAVPYVLPFGECPGAVAGALGLIGTPLRDIRETVLERLRGPAGCTHLNDALRALAEVPILVEQLAG